jgi:hypothetical protein
MSRRKWLQTSPPEQPTVMEVALDRYRRGAI